jgi:hypothetical protein
MEKNAVMDEINKTSVASLCPPLNETQLIHRLIAQYLAHDGYIETARAFAREVGQENRNLVSGIPGAATITRDLEPEEDLDAIQRQSKSHFLFVSVYPSNKAIEIRASVLEGDVDRALKLMDLYYPTVLHENENIYFKLKCRKFIEMIRRYGELSGDTSPTIPSRKSHDDYNGVFDHQMELDDQYGATQNGTHNKWDDGTMDMTDDTGGTMLDHHQEAEQLLARTLAYGQELKAEFEHDPRREVKKMLEDTIALIAYSNPRDSDTLKHMLEEKERIPVAEELNGAILGMWLKNISPHLESPTNSL